MADFSVALRRTLEYEGGYVNDSNDPGGETYCGISRRAHPAWTGWERIDAYKKSSAFPTMLKGDAAVVGGVRAFYQKYYWSPVSGDAYRSQDVADEMFDIAVHLGPPRAVRFLQTALNVLNRDERLYKNLKVDGIYGRVTEATVKNYQRSEPSAFLIKLLVIQRGAFYIEAVKKREESEAFIRGWLRRVKIR